MSYCPRYMYRTVVCRELRWQWWWSTTGGVGYVRLLSRFLFLLSYIFLGVFLDCFFLCMCSGVLALFDHEFEGFPIALTPRVFFLIRTNMMIGRKNVELKIKRTLTTWYGVYRV